MSQRRMFSMKVIDTDMFLDMPQSSRLLYYDLNMRADDDGFVDAPKKIARMIGCSDDDLKLLIAKQFLIPFENGVCVIRHWKIHNYIRGDRYNPTIYTDEKSQLSEDNNKMYTIGIPSGNQMSYQRLPQVRLGKVSIEEEKKEEEISKKNSLLNDEMFKKIVNVFNSNIHPINQMESDNLNDWLNKIDGEIIILAINEATLNDVRKMSYIDSILIDWNKRGLKTKEQVEYYLKEWKDSKNSKGGNVKNEHSKDTSRKDSYNTEHLLAKDIPEQDDTGII